MFNRKSSYALNKKDPNAIVYMDANEAIIRLTREDFASEKEFLKWKALSDEDYHASEKEAHVYANHTLALDELSEEAASIPAVDVCMEQAHDRYSPLCYVAPILPAQPPLKVRYHALTAFPVSAFM